MISTSRRKEVRCVSVRQPWAELIARGIKTIETRTWPTHYRGRLAIAASRRVDLGANAKRAAKRFLPTVDLWELGLGELVAVATLRDVVRLQGTSAEVVAACSPCRGKRGWLLDDVQRVEPGIQIQGKLGLFTIRLPANLSGLDRRR